MSISDNWKPACECCNNVVRMEHPTSTPKCWTCGVPWVKKIIPPDLHSDWKKTPQAMVDKLRPWQQQYLKDMKVLTDVSVLMEGFIGMGKTPQPLGCPGLDVVLLPFRGCPDLKTNN